MLIRGLCRFIPGAGVFVAALILAVGPAWAGASVSKSQGQTIYIPVYSHVYSGDTERPFYLACIVSIRNTDPSNSLVIRSVDYYDSWGKLLRTYITEPVRLAPMAAVRYLVKESDKEGGSGASFLVTWDAQKPVTQPLTESVMIGTRSQQGISFTSRGQVIAEKLE